MVGGGDHESVLTRIRSQEEHYPAGCHVVFGSGGSAGKTSDACIITVWYVLVERRHLLRSTSQVPIPQVFSRAKGKGRGLIQ